MHSSLGVLCCNFTNYIYHIFPNELYGRLPYISVMKRFLLTLLIAFLLPALSFAKDGYTLRLHFSDLSKTTIYLAHYYSKPAPIYQVDSIWLDQDGNGTLSRNAKINGGIYILVLPNMAFVEFLLNNGDDFSISATSAGSQGVVSFTGSLENDRFLKYKADMQRIASTSANAQAEMSNYRDEYVRKYPGTLLANIFKALTLPVVPAGKHYLPSGKEDTAFAFYYTKAHYWDLIDFKDERLINTPFLDSRLKDYMDKYVEHTPDSVGAAADVLLAKVKNAGEFKKFLLVWLTQYIMESPVMGMDEAFVYLVENYYMKGYADWMDKEWLQKYIERAQLIAPNVLGNKAPEINLVGINKEQVSLSSVDANYIVLMFWSPDCGACTKEAPIVDSLYKTVLKDKGVKVFAVNIDKNEQLWNKVVKEKGLTDWIHVFDPEGKGSFRADYDVYRTPTIYLLDKNKIIRGKGLNHVNISALVDILENSGNKTN